MVVESLQIKNKKGVGGIILLTLLLLPALLAFLLTLLKIARVNLNSAPKLLLFGKLSLGSAAFWSLFPIFFGTLLIIGYFGGTEGEEIEGWIFYCVALPLLLTGLGLLVYQTTCKTYLADVDNLLAQLQPAGGVLCVEVSRLVNTSTSKYSDTVVRDMLQDLQANKVVVLREERPGGVFFAQVIAPELKLFYASRSSDFVENAVGEAWTCHSCGASNTGMSLCEYCGEAKK